jgi:hypothetical protein
MTTLPPDNIQAAAASVRAYLDAQERRVLSPEERAKLSDAEKLDYARRFDQSKMPGWKDPRAS